MLRLFVSLGAVCSGQRESEDNRTDFIWFSERGPGVPPPPRWGGGGYEIRLPRLRNRTQNSWEKDPKKYPGNQNSQKGTQKIPEKGGIA